MALCTANPQIATSNRRWPPRRVEQAHRIASFIGHECDRLTLDPTTIDRLRQRGVTDPLAASDDAHMLGLAEQHVRTDGTVTLHLPSEGDE